MKKYNLYPAVILLVLNLLSSCVESASLIRGDETNLLTRPGLIDSSFETPDGKDHPCYRKGTGKCDGKPMTCFYEFRVEWYQSLSKACYDCPFNPADCERKDCVMANGISRPITVVNRKMPGPSIEVCQGDTIVVNVTNDLLASGTTIHWHGMHQKETPFMDGVPFVTQCPVQPESTFTYKFKAEQAGTFFWHSHIGLQRGDGVSGALIIRKQRTKESHRLRSLFEEDWSEHVIQVSDWSRHMSLNVFTNHYHSAGSMAPQALLINGRGRFEVTNGFGNRTITTKAPRFNVTKGTSYRFRFINAEFYFCPVELSVDGHTITIIASDGNDLKPITVKSFISYAGERFDFVIKANQKRDNYWIRVRGLMNCENSTAVRQVAVLHYRGARDDEPSKELTWEPRIHNEMELNSENLGEEQNVTITMSQLQADRDLAPKDDILKETPDHKFYVSYDLHIKNNALFNKSPLYDHKHVEKINRSYSVPTPQLNHISMKLPKSPLLVSRPSESSFCNHTNTIPEHCKNGFCRCPHVLSVKLNSVVEVIIIDEGSEINANHPFHLHGHSFRVLGQRRLNISTTLEEVRALDTANKTTRNLRNPPIKDTVTVPDGGYTIIRFKANNPGYWLFHCHIEFHAEVGMALVFKVGEHEDMKPVPPNFPKCGDYSAN